MGAGFIHFIAKFTLSKFVTSRFECIFNILGKNNVHVQPQGRDTYLPGYLSLHQITKENEQLPRLALKWTPNQLMNAGGKIQNEEKYTAPSWQEALYIDLNSILFLHCHQVLE